MEKYTRRNCNRKRWQKEGIPHCFAQEPAFHSWLPSEGAWRGPHSGFARRGTKGRRRDGDRLLRLPGTSVLPFPAPQSFIGAWNITSFQRVLIATSVVLQNVLVAPSQSSAQQAADMQAWGYFCKAPKGNERSCLFGSRLQLRHVHLRWKMCELQIPQQASELQEQGMLRGS